MFALNAVGQIGQHQAASQGVKARNRARLKNFEAANQNYLNEVKLNNAEWKNDVQVQEIEQDKVYQSMVDQWTQQDAQLDRIFADADFQMQEQLIKMYESDYAGTQTGRTAGRLAGKSAKKYGFEKAKLLSNMMLAKKETDINKDAIRTQASRDSNSLFEKVRFAPVHGHTPIAPELEAKPSKAGLILGLATSALGAYGQHKALKAVDVTGGSTYNPNTSYSFQTGIDSPINATSGVDIAAQTQNFFENPNASAGLVGDFPTTWNTQSTYPTAGGIQYDYASTNVG